MIKLYGSSACVPCRNSKRYLDKIGMPFEYFDVTIDPQAFDVISALGYTGIPVVITETGDHWQGFKPERFDSLRED